MGSTRTLVNVTITDVSDKSPTYVACSQCYAKLQDLYCEKCRRRTKPDDVTFRYCLVIVATDTSMSANVTVFGSSLNTFLGGSPKLVHGLIEKCPDLWCDVLRSCLVGRKVILGIKTNKSSMSPTTTLETVTKHLVSRNENLVSTQIFPVNNDARSFYKTLELKLAGPVCIASPRTLTAAPVQLQSCERTTRRSHFLLPKSGRRSVLSGGGRNSGRYSVMSNDRSSLLSSLQNVSGNSRGYGVEYLDSDVSGISSRLSDITFSENGKLDDLDFDETLDEKLDESAIFCAKSSQMSVVDALVVLESQDATSSVSVGNLMKGIDFDESLAEETIASTKSDGSERSCNIEVVNGGNGFSDQSTYLEMNDCDSPVHPLLDQSQPKATAKRVEFDGSMVRMEIVNMDSSSSTVSNDSDICLLNLVDQMERNDQSEPSSGPSHMDLSVVQSSEGNGKVGVKCGDSENHYGFSDQTTYLEDNPSTDAAGFGAKNYETEKSFRGKSTAEHIAENLVNLNSTSSSVSNDSDICLLNLVNKMEISDVEHVPDSQNSDANTCPESDPMTDSGHSQSSVGTVIERVADSGTYSKSPHENSAPESQVNISSSQQLSQSYDLAGMTFSPWKSQDLGASNVEGSYCSEALRNDVPDSEDMWEFLDKCSSSPPKPNRTIDNAKVSSNHSRTVMPVSKCVNSFNEIRPNTNISVKQRTIEIVLDSQVENKSAVNDSVYEESLVDRSADMFDCSEDLFESSYPENPSPVISKLQNVDFEVCSEDMFKESQCSPIASQCLFSQFSPVRSTSTPVCLPLSTKIRRSTDLLRSALKNQSRRLGRSVNVSCDASANFSGDMFE